MAEHTKNPKRPAARFRSRPLEVAPAAPKSAAPKSAAPKADAPKADAPKADARRIEATSSGGTVVAPRRSKNRGSVGVGEGAVLLTGICGGLGRLLARTLHRDDSVVGIDRRAFGGRPKDIVHHQFDVRRKKTRDVFRAGGIRAVVHLGVMHDPRASDKEHHSWNVRGFQKLLEYLAEFEIPKLVVLSSANAYGPQPDNPQFLTEEAPLLGAQTFSAIRDLVEVDMLAQSFFWRNPATETVILRPCHILGSVRNAASNYLRLERPITVLGYDPMVQVIHERDVVDAMVLALRPGVRGIFNLRGPAEVPLSRLFRMLERKPIAVPGPLAEGVLSRLWRYRLTSFPTPELDHVRYVCMVDDTRARTMLGYAPKRSLEETAHAVESDR